MDQSRLDAAVARAGALGQRLGRMERRDAERRLGRADADWDESKHKRGQPKNAGQFGSGGGGAKSEAKGGEEKPAAKQPELSPEEKAAKVAKVTGKQAGGATAGPVKGMEGGARPPFDPSETDKLPDKKSIAQPFKSWDEAKAAGEKARVEFVDALDQVKEKLGLSTDVRSPEELTNKHLTGKDRYLFIGPNKSEARSREKVQHDYQGDWSKLKDMVRGTIAVNSVAEMREAIKAVEESGLKLAAKPQDRFTHPNKEGYRDLLTLVELPNGVIAELQYHLKPILQAKNEGHDMYEAQEKIRRKNGGSDEPTNEWSDEDAQRFLDLRAKQKAIYDPAWERAISAKG